MKKLFKKLLVLIVLPAVALFNVLPFIPLSVAHAALGDTITLRLDNAEVTGNVITFDVDGVMVTVTASGNGFYFEGTELKVPTTEINTLKLALGNNFDRDHMDVQLSIDSQPTITGDNEVVFGDVDFSQDDAPHLQIVRTGNDQGGDGEHEGGEGEHHGGDNTQNFQGNATATLNYSINGAIEYTSGGGYDHGITFRINDIPYAADQSKMVYTEGPAYERSGYGELILDENGNPIPILDPVTMQPLTEKTGLTITGDTINYDYDEQSGKVRFTFAMAPGTLMTGLVINGEVISLPDEASELEACYIDHRIEINVDDIAKADEYNIEITARYPNSDEEFLGNFLWDYNPQGYTSPDDKILNGTLVFVEAEYNGVTYTSTDEIESLGGVYIWKDAQRKKVYTEDKEGVGEAQFPVGTKLTVKIIPDAGYQLVDFGINGGVFETQEEVGTYQFTVSGGPFHLHANIRQVEDVVKTTSEKIKSGNITLGGSEEAMSIGTARLDVKDIELSKEQISNFEDAATGYNVNNYVDISLFNTVYKGRETQSWDTLVEDLQNDAVITLQLEDGVKGDEIVIVHEKHDGTYEIIPVEYDKETNTISFKTKSFSNYAIATKTVEESISNTSANPNTLDNAISYVLVLTVSLAGLSLSKLYFRRLKNN